MNNPSLTLHGMKLSGHCHRVELLLNMLGLPYRFVEAAAAVRSTPEFRALNPLGQIPVLTDGDLVQCDSAAIMVYLVKRYAPDSDWLPAGALSAAEVQRWLAISAGEVKYGPATARMISLWNAPGNLAEAQQIAGKLLRFMDGHLSNRRYLASEEAPTLADLACYSYVAHAPEGGIALEPYPDVQAWLRHVEELPGFVPMPKSAAKVAA